MLAKLQILSGWIWILLIAILNSCQSQPTLIPEQTKQIGLLVSLDAPTFIKRDGWKDYQRIAFGAMVYPTDLLKTDGEIKVLCADMQTIKILTKTGRNPCPLSSSDRVLSYDEMYFISSARGMPPSTIPYILHPRSTTILEAHPLLRWNDTKASSYTVQIWQGTNIVWQQGNVSKNETTYPSRAPELKPGKDYLLVVIDNDTGESSSTDPNKGLGFQVVSTDERTNLEEQQRAIQKVTALDASAQKLALAIYFNQLQIDGRGLWGNATDLLTEVSQSHPNSPAVHLRLGDSFAKIKLWAEARSEYDVALSKAQSLTDLESQADALAAIWHITGDQTNFDQAVNIYEQIGAEDKADQMRNFLVPSTVPTSFLNIRSSYVNNLSVSFLIFLIVGLRMKNSANC
jgi:hypothetical protein